MQLDLRSTKQAEPAPTRSAGKSANAIKRQQWTLQRRRSMDPREESSREKSRNVRPRGQGWSKNEVGKTKRARKKREKKRQKKWSKKKRVESRKKEGRVEQSRSESSRGEQRRAEDVAYIVSKTLDRSLISQRRQENYSTNDKQQKHFIFSTIVPDSASCLLPSRCRERGSDSLPLHRYRAM